MSALHKILEAVPDMKPAHEKVYTSLVAKFPLLPIRNGKQHQAAKSFLIVLIDWMNTHSARKADVQETIEGYMETLGDLIASYEATKFPAATLSGVDVLKFLMEQHGLTQRSFSKEIGAQSVVCRIFSGERDLTVTHISRLSKRFGVSPDVFFDKDD